MTRINVGILPKELKDKQLLAEHREIIRIPNNVRKGRYNLEGQPLKFKLGTGHVKFFYNKLEYLKLRYNKIYEECISRGFKVQYYGDCFKDLNPELCNDYIPTKRDRKILIGRLREKKVWINNNDNNN